MDREQILYDLKEWLRDWPYDVKLIPLYVLHKIMELEDEYE